MNAQIVSAAVGVVGTLVGTLGGALIGALTQREARKTEALKNKVERYRTEIRARQAEEEVAAEWLFSLGAANTALAAKRTLRRKTEEKRGVRPVIGPKEVNF